MKFYRLRQMGFAAVLGLSLVLSSFAAPLCACLNATAKTSHDCCEKMKDHCPMKTHKGFSPDKASHSGCECFAEKRRTPPTKIYENVKTSPAPPALLTHPQFPNFGDAPKQVAKFFITVTSFQNPPSRLASARAPPCL
jgi:hypothetical protein